MIGYQQQPPPSNGISSCPVYSKKYFEIFRNSSKTQILIMGHNGV